jgi:class 3 adenylate cyclase
VRAKARALRYLKVTLICGALATCISAGLLELGAFQALDRKLAAFLGQSAPGEIHRLSQYLVVILCAFGLSWTTVDIIRTPLKVAIGSLALFELITAAWVLDLYGLFFSPFAGVLAGALGIVGGLIYSQTAAGRRKRELSHVIGDRVSPHMFKALVDSDAPINFEGEIREGTVVVCEILNQDELLQALDTKEYVAMTNAFLRTAGDFMVERGGYLDECDGESLRILFGAPLPDSQHAARACDAALDLQARLDAVNLECLERWGSRLDFRMGINSGEMVLAAYGSRRLGGLGVSGEPVEFARRLCAANTIYGSRILLGNGAFVLAESTIEVRPMELIQRHREDPAREEVYELLAGRGELSGDDESRRDLFWKGVILYREKKWDEALTNFRLARELAPNDQPAEFYIRRIEQLRAGVAALDFKP